MSKQLAREALRAGASGFLLKDTPEDQLIAAIRVAADGGAIFSPSVTRRLIEEISKRARRREPLAALSELTPRELEVLQLVARGLSNAEIARSSSSASTRRSSTSRASSPSSIYATVCRPSSSLTSRGSSSPAKDEAADLGS